ncbi:MAG: NusG domain II-containing protein [Candidatus Cloacimonadaceae bacterium]|jgi:hypothetical protein|nr:NusG domain II-containing protein [Candidatus Cloacimonadota bacterium]MDY0126835.1 NusG domain II-containing protein [Candidatus Cloacimonadaceae bacterium]MCB5255077.1 NusG domain II-containing protein [Candidatus Cloacimonadota bacterium]MCK9177610.1 NusG domain II-containing protein [Candidatus Cloacimonadota bacterium]MCK9241636.1 NusG domain II-containing protein [Candidatus Cloacimonadota bacterium]
MTINIFKKLSISDAILILACLIVAYLLWRNFSAATDEMLYIYKEDALWGEYELSHDTIIEIDQHNTVQIQDGKARMLSSDCPDKRCVRQGFNKSMPIICLPNRIVLEFEDREKQRKLILQ